MPVITQTEAGSRDDDTRQLGALLTPQTSELVVRAELALITRGFIVAEERVVDTDAGTVTITAADPEIGRIQLVITDTTAGAVITRQGYGTAAG
jgi:hypothetical protein